MSSRRLLPLKRNCKLLRSKWPSIVTHGVMYYPETAKAVRLAYIPRVQEDHIAVSVPDPWCDFNNTCREAIRILGHCEKCQVGSTLPMHFMVKLSAMSQYQDENTENVVKRCVLTASSGFIPNRCSNTECRLYQDLTGQSSYQRVQFWNVLAFTGEISVGFFNSMNLDFMKTLISMQ